jgi:hypothetical protein
VKTFNFYYDSVLFNYIHIITYYAHIHLLILLFISFSLPLFLSIFISYPLSLSLSYLYLLSPVFLSYPFYISVSAALLNLPSCHIPLYNSHTTPQRLFECLKIIILFYTKSPTTSLNRSVSSLTKTKASTKLPNYKCKYLMILNTHNHKTGIGTKYC